MTDERGLLRAGVVRASDRDREDAATAMRTAFEEGRLTQDEFTARLDQAYRAVTLDDLRPLRQDLGLAKGAAPAVRPPMRPYLAPDSRPARAYLVPARPARWLALALFAFACWTPLIYWNGPAGVFWDGSDMWPLIPCFGTVIAFVIAMLWTPDK